MYKVGEQQVNFCSLLQKFSGVLISSLTLQPATHFFIFSAFVLKYSSCKVDITGNCSDWTFSFQHGSGSSSVSHLARQSLYQKVCFGWLWCYPLIYFKIYVHIFVQNKWVLWQVLYVMRIVQQEIISLTHFIFVIIGYFLVEVWDKKCHKKGVMWCHFELKAF